GRSEKNAEEAKEDFFSVQNSRKAYIGMMGGLLDPQLMARKKKEHEGYKKTAATIDRLESTRGAWDKIAAAEKVRTKILRPYTMLERGIGFNSELFGYARTLLRAGEERTKDNGVRL